MYNVLIVDDEPVIREGLKTLIPWEECGFMAAGTASGGQAALNYYHNNDLDLIVVDIRMPGMDGLELIEKIRSKDKEIQFIILSGYADFEYAQKAISFNVAAFLLKPVDEEEFTNRLVQLKQHLDKERNSSVQHDSNPARQREKILQSLLDENGTAGYLEDPSQFNLSSRHYQLLLIQLLPERHLDLNQLSADKERLTRLFEPDKGIIFVYGRYIGILLKTKAESEESRRQLSAVIKQTFDGEKAACSLSAPFAELTAVKHAYIEAEQLLEEQFFYLNQPILTKHSPRCLSVQIKENASFQLNSLIDRLYYSIDLADDKAVGQRLTEAAQSMINLNFSEEEIKRTFWKMITLTASKCSADKKELRMQTSELLEEMTDLSMQPNLTELLTYIQSSLHKLMRVMDPADSAVQIKKLVDFIDRRYYENLKLETLAELFNYNSAYLGKLFKNYTGTYFNTYLDCKRIEQAKLLLTEGMKVYQVAEKVGYTNVDYFHNKFKKHTGMSPTTYRKCENLKAAAVR